jgi:ATP-binding cassette, subfamily C (CFTR/MRP), member 1
MDEYGALEKEQDISEEGQDGADVTQKLENLGVQAHKVEQKPQEALMQQEERNKGAVTWETYRKYLKYSGSILWGPIILALLALGQCATGESFLCWFGRCVSKFRYLSVANQLFLGNLFC